MKFLKSISVDTLTLPHGWNPGVLQHKTLIPCRSCLKGKNHRYTWARFDPIETESLNSPTSLLNLPPPPFTRQQSSFTFTQRRTHHWPNPSNRLHVRAGLCRTKGTAGLLSLLIWKSSGDLPIWKVTKLPTEYHLPKRTKTTLTTGKEEALHRDWVYYTAPSAAVLLRAPRLTQARQRVTGSQRWVCKGITPRLAVDAALLAQKSTWNSMKNIPSV